MIKLKCPRCGSDNIHYVKTLTFGDSFECNDCKELFPFVNAEWEQE
jgi:transposase-like protein